MKRPKILIWFTLAYVVLFAFSAIEPTSQAVWIAEIIPVVFALIVIWWTSFYLSLSKTAYIFCFIWIVLHTIGAKYTFTEVPFDWFNDLIGSERNNFDRLAHFSIGLYAYPIAEWLLRKRLAKPWLSYTFALFAIMSVAAGYEIIEWWYAVINDNAEDGMMFLGSQGDVWDVQKDMLCDTLGAITALIIMMIQRHRDSMRFNAL